MIWSLYCMSPCTLDRKHVSTANRQQSKQRSLFKLHRVHHTGYSSFSLIYFYSINSPPPPLLSLKNRPYTGRRKTTKRAAAGLIYTTPVFSGSFATAGGGLYSLHPGLLLLRTAALRGFQAIIVRWTLQRGSIITWCEV